MARLSNTITADALDAARRAVSTLRSVPRSPEIVGALGDSELLELIRLTAESRRLLDTVMAVAAGEVGARSDPAFGGDGLSRRHGHRRPELLVQQVTGDLLGAVAIELVAASDGLDADRLRRTAREARAALDDAGTADREAALRAKRSLRLIRHDDGAVRLVWIMDPVTAAEVTSIYDRTTSPRRGGPRFVDAQAAEEAARILADERTTEQLASDAFAALLRLGSEHPNDLFVSSDPVAVKILVTADTLVAGAGVGSLEGTGEPVSLASVEAGLCAGTSQTIVFDASGGALDVGREQRRFTRRQRQALNAIWGGCALPNCERPPSWTEAHHTTPWAQGGRTDVRDALPLCRVHHLDLHQRHWMLQRDGADWFLRLDDDAPPLRLAPKSPAWRELRRRHGTARAG